MRSIWPNALASATGLLPSLWGSVRPFQENTDRILSKSPRLRKANDFSISGAWPDVTVNAFDAYFVSTHSRFLQSGSAARRREPNHQGLDRRATDPKSDCVITRLCCLLRRHNEYWEGELGTEDQINGVCSKPLFSAFLVSSSRAPHPSTPASLTLVYREQLPEMPFQEGQMFWRTTLCKLQESFTGMLVSQS